MTSLPNHGKYLGIDMFTLHNKNYLCIVDYHSKFPVIKKMEDVSYHLVIIPIPKHTHRGSMYQTYKANTQKCFDTKSDLHIA